MTRLVLKELRSRLAGPFTLDVASGECVAITGPSGSGKSLFLRLVADLDPGEGEAWLDGRPRREWAAPAWRHRVAYVAAESGWWAESVAAHVPPALLGAARGLAGRLGLDPALLDGPVARLSTGERQRLALVRALVAEPSALLLDEPTGPLDAASVGRVEAVLRARLEAGAACLLVTHDPAQAARLGRRHLRMEAGRLHPADVFVA